MKKLFLMLFLCSVFCKVTALDTGDEALELKSKFYNGKVFKVKFYMVDKKNHKKLKVLVFARLLADDFLRSDALINNIGSRKGVSLAFATPSEQEIETYLKLKKDFKYPLLFDKDGHKKYMEQKIIYPYAFVVNYENRIIWSGELIDLPEMLDEFEQDKFDYTKNLRINRYLNDMQNALRSGSEYQFDRAAREILALDPGNIACLRLRMFSFENTNRQAAAWAFLEEFRRKNPQEKHLYMLQIDMGARYPVFSDRGAAVGREFIKAGLGTNDDKLLLAWMFINGYNFNADALECAESLLSVLKSDVFKSSPVQQALYHRASALAAYKRCDIMTAVKEQQKSCDISESAENKKILEYYKKITKK